MIEAIGRNGLALLATSSFALASVHGAPAVAALLGLTGFVVLVVAARAGDGSVPLLRTAGIAALLAAFFGWGTRMMAYPPTGLWTLVLWMAGPVVAALVLVVTQVPRARRVAGILVLASALYATLGIMVEYQGSPIGTDVYLVHVQAADALRMGADPYSDAVEVPNGSPYAEPGSVVTGYPYPPPALIGYAGAALLFGDPRWMSAVAHIVILGGLGWFGLVRNQDGALAALVVVGAFPNWRMVEFSGWTEPLTLALFLAAAAAWRRSAAVGGVALGLALVSKQYLVVLIGLVISLAWRGIRSEAHRKRAMGMAVGGLLGVAPILLWSVENFIQAAVITPATIPFRPDSQSLSGLAAQLGATLLVPAWVAVGAGIAVGAMASRRLRSGSDLLEVSALALGVLFLLAMAFPNYWYLVMGLAAGSVAIDWAGSGEVSGVEQAFARGST